MNIRSENSTRINVLAGLSGSTFSLPSIILLMAIFTPDLLAAQEKSVAGSVKVEPARKNIKVTFIEQIMVTSESGFSRCLDQIQKKLDS